MAAKKPTEPIPTVDEWVDELVKRTPPLTEDQLCRAARLWVAAERSTDEANRLTA